MSNDWENNLTYESEGNNNLKSKWCSLKLHHPSAASGVTIGRGYDLSKREPNEIRKDLNEAGFPKEKIEVLVKGAGLTGKAADEFVKDHANFEISVQEQKNLFSAIYPQYVKDTQRIFAKVWKDVPDAYKEILIDLRYRGDINKTTRGLLMPAVEKLLKGDSSEIDNIIKDRAFWKSKRCDQNRIERRIKRLIDSRNVNNSSVSTTDSSDEIKVDYPKGGVDLSLNDFNLKFCGLIYDKNLDEFLICQPSADKKASRKNMVRMDDLGVVLKVYCDPTIKSKMISFSLDPFEKTNPNGPFMRKVFYPDQIEGRRILAGTKLGEEMFKADFVMKQMSLGIKPDNKSKFEYPEELLKMGLRPQHELREDMTEGMKWSRSWIVVRDVGTYKTRGEMLLLDSLRMGVEGRQMVVMKDGTLKDSAIQDKNDECYKFSSKLSGLYDLTGKYYESFMRLKEITNAIIMAKWIWENNVPVDLNLIDDIYKANLLDKFEEKVPSINFTEILETEEKIPVDIQEIARRSLAQSKMEATQANLEMAVKQIKGKMPGKEFFDTRINKRQYFLFGGVDLSSNLMKEKIEKNLLEEEKSEENDSFSTNESENGFDKVITRSKKRINVDLTEFNVKILPLVSREYCDVCENELKVTESKNCRMLKKMIGDKHFCFIHNPYTCAGCLKTVAGTHMLIKNRNYHPECVKCFECSKGIKETAIVCEEGALFHKDCYEKYFKMRAPWMVDDKLGGLIPEMEMGGKIPPEKRKSEELDNAMSLLKVGEKEKDQNRDRGKTTIDKGKPLIQKAVKKM